MKSWLQTRADWIDSNFLAPPTFSAAGGIVSPGFILAIQNPAGQTGTLYHSLDSQDPMDSLIVYENPITLTSSAQVSARLLTTSGNWSAIMRNTFVVGTPASSENLIISEINYHPADELPDTEFIELLNTSAETIDLSLTLIQPGIHPDLSAPLNWRPGLSPGTTDTRPLIGTDLTQHVLGQHPPTLTNGALQYQIILGADDFLVIPQESPDLQTWLDLPTPTQPTAMAPDGNATYTLPLTPDFLRKFLRFKILPR